MEAALTLHMAERMAEFVFSLNWRDQSGERRHKLNWCIADFLACTAAATRFAEADAAYVLTRPGDIDVFGVERRFDPESAALSMGTLGSLLQLHDVYPYGGNHPSSAVIPAAWVGWKLHDAGIEEFVAAVAAGYEVANRLAACGYPRQPLAGSAPTATMGAVGAAAAAGRLAGLDRPEMAAALGIAAFNAPIALYQSLRDHGSVVPLHSGLAARTGLEAVRLAQAGLKPGPNAFEGELIPGFVRFLHGEPDQLTPESWDGGSLDAICLKLIPACFAAQPVLESALTLLQETTIDPQSVTHIDVGAAKRTYNLVGPGPSAELELYDRLMSLRWMLASAVAHNAYGLGNLHPGAESPQTGSLIDLIEFRTVPAYDEIYPAEMAVDLAVHDASGAIHRISHRRPLIEPEKTDQPRGFISVTDDAVLLDKFKRLCADTPAGAGGEAMLAALELSG